MKHLILFIANIFSYFPSVLIMNIIAGEMLILAEPFLRSNIHPSIIVQGYNLALQEALKICDW